MNFRGQPLTICFKLLLAMLVVSFLPIAIVGLFGLRSATAIMHEQAGIQSREQTSLISGRISQQVHSYLDLAKTMVVMLQHKNAEEARSSDAMSEVLAEVCNLNEGLAYIAVVGPEGKVAAASRQGLQNARLSANSGFRAAFDGEPVVGTVGHDPLVNEKTLHFNVPIPTGGDGEYGAVLSIAVRWAYVCNLITALPIGGVQQSEADHVMVIDRQGLVLICYVEEEILVDNMIGLGMKSADSQHLVALGFNPKDGPAMVIPYPHPNVIRHCRIRPDSDRAFQEGAKYRTRAGDTNALYIPLNAWEVTDDTSAQLLVIEGEKKTLAAMQAGYVAVGVPGVYGWRSDGATIKDLDEFKWRERPVIICFDSDVWSNSNVQEALRRLVRELEGREADVRVVLLPEGENGAKIGVDDFLLANGPCAFRTLVDAALPLADAALAFIRPGMNPNRLQMALDFVNCCIGSYPAIRDEYTGKLRGAMESAGYGKQSKRTLSSGITRAIKFIARLESSGGGEDCPENTAAEFLDSECKTESGILTLHLLNGQLYTYEPDSVYREISEEELKLDIVRWLQANKTQVTRNLVADVAMNVKALCELPPETPVPSWINNDSSKNNNWLAFQGGLIQMQMAINGTPFFENHTPEFLTTAIMPFHFMQNAQCPRWLQFLAQTFDGDHGQISRLQEWFGAHIDLDLRIEKFAMFVGEGSNGKSVVLRILAALLGAENIVSIQLDKLGERFQPGRLRGKTANIVSDLEDTDKAAEGLLKMLVSQEEISGEHKNQTPFTFVPKARHTFATNAFPRFRDRSNGLWRRLLLFVFNNVVPEDQQNIRLADEIVERELAGIFNWALAGARRLQENGLFSESASCTREASRYRVDCNPVATFLEQCCFTGNEHEIQKHLVYESYSDWCKQNGYKALSNGRFGRELKRLLPGLGETRPHVEGTRVVWYQGLALAEIPQVRQRSW